MSSRTGGPAPNAGELDGCRLLPRPTSPALPADTATRPPGSPYTGPPVPPLPTLDGTLVVDFALLGKAGVDAGNAADSMSTAWTALSAAALFGAAPWGDDPALGQGFDQVFAQPRTTC